jgi:predicted nucleic acid-binding protein
MIVLDASAAVDWFLTTPGGRVVGTRILAYGESLHAPQMFDLEVTQAFRKLARAGALSESRAEEAVQDLRRVRIIRYSHLPLLPGIWSYRHNLTAYDAAYVVLAETLEATLITRDGGMAAACRNSVRVEVY